MDAVERIVMRLAGCPTDTAAVRLLVVLTVPSSIGTDTVHTIENFLMSSPSVLRFKIVLIVCRIALINEVEFHSFFLSFYYTALSGCVEAA